MKASQRAATAAARTAEPRQHNVVWDLQFDERVFDNDGAATRRRTGQPRVDGARLVPELELSARGLPVVGGGTAAGEPECDERD